MKATHLLVIAFGLATLGGGLAATLDLSATSPEPPAPRATAAAATGTDDHEDGHARDHAALRQEIASLRAELRAGKDEDRGASTSEDELSALKQELAALREQVAMIAGANGNPAAVAGDGDDDFAPMTEEEMALAEEDDAYDEEDRRRGLDAFLGAQSIDTTWSQDAALAVTEASDSEELAGSIVDGVECRSSLCRVEVSHADAEAAGQFELLFPMQVADALPQIRYFTEQLGDGRSITVMYLAREGYELPAEDQ